MFEQLFKQVATVQRYRAAPLAQSRLDYLAHYAGQGARPATLKPIAFIQVVAARYLELGEQDTVSLSRVEAAADRWVSEDPGRRGGSASRARRRFVRYATAWLRFAGRLEIPPSEPDPHAAEVQAFADFMRKERGLSEKTIRGYRHTVLECLRRLCEEHGSLADISITDIDVFLEEQGTRNGACRGSAHGQAKALRVFFRYAEQQGWSAPGLATAIVSPRVYAGEGLPAGPSPEDILRLVATTEGNRPSDLRARAILLLLCAYGLRAGEVAGLRLDDIDWEAETLRVRRAKSARTDRYPLSRRVGNAILDYLRAARPRRADREIFLTLKAPIVPVGSTGVSRVVGDRMRGLGIACKRRGAHALRHAFAQRLLEEDFSMQEIGDCLGHRSLDSTAIYAKVDYAAFRTMPRWCPKALQALMFCHEMSA